MRSGARASADRSGGRNPVRPVAPVVPVTSVAPVTGSAGRPVPRRSAGARRDKMAILVYEAPR